MQHKFFNVAQKVKTMASITGTHREAIKEESKAHLKQPQAAVVEVFKD